MPYLARKQRHVAIVDGLPKLLRFLATLAKNMNQEREWCATKAQFRNGSGIRVECDGQLGFAKSRNWWNEKLASVLAQFLGVAVPAVEFGRVKSWGDWRFAISHVCNETSRPLRNDEDEAQGSVIYTPTEIDALKAASGLLPFLVWIGAGDHNKDSNLVVCEREGHLPSIVAIDFEDAFDHIYNPENDPSYLYPFSPPGIRENFDTQKVEATLEMIEQFAEERIRDCCIAAEVPSGMMEQVINALTIRKGLIRCVMLEQGWLPR